MSTQNMPSKSKEKKIGVVAELKAKLEKTKSLFLMEYQGLTHQQLETLRKALKKADAEFAITKNRLLKLALKEWNSESAAHLDEALQKPTATLFAYGDEVAPIKTLAAFIKANTLPKIKLGIFAGKKATEDQFNMLAMLPTRDILLATLAMRLKSPLYGLHYALNWNLTRLVVALNNVKEKKTA